MQFPQPPMKVNEPSFEEMSGGKIRDKLDFSFILYKQIDRGLDFISTDAKRFILTVEGLEILLQPYLDEKYNNKIEDIRTKYMEVVERNAMQKDGSQNQEYKFEMDFKLSRIRFRELMKTISRRGLLPLEEYSGEI